MTSRSRRKRPITAKSSRGTRTATSRRLFARAALFAGALAAGFLGSAASADELAPRRFVPDEGAQAIATSAEWTSREEAKASAFERTESGSTLRWRVKQPASTSTAKSTGTSLRESVRPTAAAETSSLTPRLSFAERSRAASRVQNAVAFEDPFGDRGHTVRRAQAEVPLEDEPPMEFNQPMRLQPEPMAEEPKPEDSPQAEMADEKKPFAKYNERNCGKEKGDCDTHRNKIRDDKLSDKLDLIDITPGITLATDSAEGKAGANATLQRIPVRTWHNRAGQVLIRGKLIQVAHRFVVIQSEEDAEDKKKIPLNQLGDDEQCFLAGWWQVPSECILSDAKHEKRNFEPSTMTWTASALCHKPLYFEEVQVERYGHTAGLVQPVLSGAHFFTSIAFLPYNMGIHPPNECQYALGYYRPGNCAPWLVPPVPLSIRGAAVQAGVVTGVSAIIP